MTGATITSDSYTVTLDTVNRIDFNTTRKINTYVFTDDSDEILDEGKNIDQIILNGIQTTNYNSSMVSLNNIMDSQEEITLSGLDDNYLNTEYMINDLKFNALTGTPAMYEFSITLERMYDRLPYSEL